MAIPAKDVEHLVRADAVIPRHIESRQSVKILHVITDLNVGGAEMMLLKLLGRWRASDFVNRVVSLTTSGALGPQIREMGIELDGLGLTRASVPSPRVIWQLVKIFRTFGPDIVQTWMYHADLLGGIAASLAGRRKKTIWNIRSGGVLKDFKRSTLWTIRLCARLSGSVPYAIICASENSMRDHVNRGYAAEKMIVIPNGFDCRAFKPDPEARVSVRRELSIPVTAPVIGLVGRFDPLKDHFTFLEAAGRIHAQFPEAHFLLCGEDVDEHNNVLTSWTRNAGLGHQAHLLGRRADIPRLTAAFDIACSSSVSEGFPNIVGEAMACGVPCVVTDVGDSRKIVGDTGIVVPARDPIAFAEACNRLLQLPDESRRNLGRAAREWIVQRFSIEAVADRYAALYREAAALPGS